MRQCAAAVCTSRSSAAAPAGSAAIIHSAQWKVCAPRRRLPPPPPPAAAAPPRRLDLKTMSLPRSMDTHSAEGQGAKIVAAAAERNKEPILAVLREFLGDDAGLFLEVASGTGQHTAHFAAALPQLTFQPSENQAAEDCLASIRAWGQGLPNVRPPVQLDAAAHADAWPVGPGTCRAVYAANLTHISPWAATTGLIKGAGRALAPGGELFIYGPFSVDGRPTTESNAAFDASLRARNPAWGYRDVGDVSAAAAVAGLAALERRAMPANNFMLVFRKQ